MHVQLGRWETLENYKLQDQSLRLLFNKLCPQNANIEDRKVALHMNYLVSVEIHPSLIIRPDLSVAVPYAARQSPVAFDLRFGHFLCRIGVSYDGDGILN